MFCRSRTSRSKERSHSTPRTQTRRSLRSSRYGHRRARPTCLSSCSTTSASPRSSAFGGPVRDADGRAAGRKRPEVQPLPHDGAVRPDAGCLAERPQPPLGGNGRHHRARHVGARLQLDSPQYLRAAGADAAAERLFDLTVRQVPRGAGLADEPDGALRCLAHRWQRLRVLLRLHRRRDESVLPGDLRRHDAGGAGEDARGGLPLHRRHDREGDQVGAAAEVADARQAVLHVLRSRRDARAASRSDGVVGQVQGSLRRGLGRRCARRSSPARRSWESCPPRRS